MINQIKKHIDNLHWYNQAIFIMYFSTNASIRDISRETGISSISIFKTLKKIKEEINSKFGKNYTDYKNYIPKSNKYFKKYKDCAMFKIEVKIKNDRIIKIKKFTTEKRINELINQL